MKNLICLPDHSNLVRFEQENLSSPMPSSCRNLCSAFSAFQLCFPLGFLESCPVPALAKDLRGVSPSVALFWDFPLSLSSCSGGPELQFHTRQPRRLLLSARVPSPCTTWTRECLQGKSQMNESLISMAAVFQGSHPLQFLSAFGHSPVVPNKFVLHVLSRFYNCYQQKGNLR